MERNKTSESLKRIKKIVKEYGSARPGKWVYASRSDIKPRDRFDTAELFVDGDYDKPDLLTAREVIRHAEEALSRLDEIRKDTFHALEELDDRIIENYWDAVEQIESDINVILHVLGFESFEGNGEAIRHIIRVIDRFDFKALPKVRNIYSTKEDSVCPALII